MKIRFKQGDRIYLMKVIKELENGDMIVIDGSTVEKKDIIEKI